MKKAPDDSHAVCQSDPPAFAESQTGFTYHQIPVSAKQFVKTNAHSNSYWIFYQRSMSNVLGDTENKILKMDITLL